MLTKIDGRRPLLQLGPRRWKLEEDGHFAGHGRVASHLDATRVDAFLQREPMVGEQGKVFVLQREHAIILARWRQAAIEDACVGILRKVHGFENGKKEQC